MDKAQYKEKLHFLINAIESDERNDWDVLVNELELNIHPDSLRKSFAVGDFSGYKVAKYFEDIMADDKYLKNGDAEDFERLVELKKSIEKERKKKQTVNIEYNKSLRFEARSELYKEIVADGMSRLKPIDIPPIKNTKKASSAEGVLFISDAHYGKDMKLYDIDGKKELHTYSTDIFKKRMWDLLSQVDAANFQYDKLTILDLGDCIEGILRMGGLDKLSTGVVDSVLEYSEFMANWIVELYKKIKKPIEYAVSGGNHDLIRILTEKKVFDAENVGALINTFIKLRIDNAKALSKKDIHIDILPYKEVVYKEILGTKIFAYHGDTKNLESDITFFENYYDINIDILVAGHLHSNQSNSIGVSGMGDKEIVRVGSIMGVDNFAKSIRKNSRPSCRFMLFTKDGKDIEKTFYLK